MSKNDEEFRVLTEKARLHATHARADIVNATSRIEHIRLTALAMEAEGIASCLEIMAARPDVARGA